MITINSKRNIGGETPTNGAAESIEAGLPYIATVTIKGSADMLLHRWNCESVDEKAKAAKNSKSKKTDNVESYVYRCDNGNIGVPGEYLRMAIINAAKFKQDPRSPRKSAMDLFKAGVVPLTLVADTGLAQWDYEDKRRVVIQRAGINRIRPALRAGWTVTFDIQVLVPEYISPELLHEVIEIAGRLIGIGDFRPTFGRYQVTSFSAP